MQNGSIIRTERQRRSRRLGVPMERALPGWRAHAPQNGRWIGQPVCGQGGRVSCDECSSQRYQSGQRSLQRKTYTLAQLADHYCQRKLTPGNGWKTQSTKMGYRGYQWIIPRSGWYTLNGIRAGEIELWLRSLPWPARAAQRFVT